MLKNCQNQNLSSHTVATPLKSDIVYYPQPKLVVCVGGGETGFASHLRYLITSIYYVICKTGINESLLKVENRKGLAVSVRETSLNWTWGHKFKSHVGHTAYLKNKIK